MKIELNSLISRVTTKAGFNLSVYALWIMLPKRAFDINDHLCEQIKLLNRKQGSQVISPTWWNVCSVDKCKSCSNKLDLKVYAFFLLSLRSAFRRQLQSSANIRNKLDIKKTLPGEVRHEHDKKKIILSFDIKS